MNELLNTESLHRMAVSAFEWLAVHGLRLPLALPVFLGGRWLVRRLTAWLDAALVRSRVEDTLRSFLCNMAHYALLTAVVLAALGQLGLNITSFLAVLGAAGLAVGLALKDSLSNFAAGVMIILMKFFKKGDFITAAGTSGTVSAIRIFNTYLTTPDNQMVVVPNNAILSGVIVNASAHETRRIDLVVGVGYGDHIPGVKAILEGLLKGEERILQDPAPLVAVSELAESSVLFVVRPWCRTEDYWAVRFDLIERIKMAFDAQGVSIPFPQVDVHLRQQTG